MDLRASLEGALVADAEYFQQKLAEIELARAALAKLDLHKLVYQVTIRSQYHDLGEESVEIAAQGLAEAIDRAEWEFERKNGRLRTDGALTYSVSVVLGERKVVVPESCWLGHSRQG